MEARNPGIEGRQKPEVKAVVVDTIEARNDMIAKPRREKTGSGEAGSWRRQHTNLAKAEANPTADMDRIVVKSRSSRAHAKTPRVTTPAKRKGSEIVAAGEISRKSDEQNETRQIEMT
jgi:hypothetical protein